MFRSIFNSRPFLWLLLSLPALPLLYGLAFGSLGLHVALHPTGETAARLTIIAMLISPLRIIFPRARWLYWLLRRRRDLGVAAFAYAAAHTAFYVIDKGAIDAILTDIAHGGIWTGWLAMLIFIPLALTSNDVSVRAMGRAWKGLQRWVYPAAVLTLLHWALLSHGIGGAIVHFLPLGLLETWRVIKLYGPHRLAQA